MKKSIKKNYIYNLAYQLLVIITPIITTPYLSRILGAEGIGTYSYTISIVTYFLLFGTLGIATYGQREIAYYQDDKQKRSKIFWELIIIRFITLFVASILFYFIYAKHGDFALYYKILTLELIASMFDISWFFQGMEEFKKIVLRNLLVKILSVIAIFVFIKAPDDISKYLMIYVATTFVGNISLWGYLKKYVVFTKINFKIIVKHLFPIISLFIPQIATQIYTVLDKTMIGSILNDMQAVGFYEQAQKIIKITLTLVTSLGIVMVPRISNLFKTGKKEEISLYMGKAFNFVWFLATPLLFGTIAITDNFVPWFYGEAFESIKILIVVLSFILHSIAFSNIIGVQYLVPVQKQNILTISVVIGAISSVLLNFLLIPLLGVFGACLATVISEFNVTIYQIFYVKKHNEFDISNIYKLAPNYLISGGIMGILVYGVGTLLKPNIISTFIQIFIGGVIYSGMLLILKDKFLLSNLEFLKHKIIKQRTNN